MIEFRWQNMQERYFESFGKADHTHCRKVSGKLILQLKAAIIVKGPRFGGRFSYGFALDVLKENSLSSVLVKVIFLAGFP
eukprot:snap_masked-scaffold_41-processed-gene-2.47-mRNA-1 protein AED:1.00 eAED:1.00 QI:0/-1/0/0/-1/1/1/0/79